MFLRRVSATLVVTLMLLLGSCASTPNGAQGSSGQPAKERVISKSILWQGETFHLAWTNDENNLVYLEYLPEGQTVDAWENMITVQMSGESQLAAIQAFTESTKPYRVEEPRLMKDDKTGDVILDVILFDTQKDSLEHNLIKFSKLKDGTLLKVFFQTKLKISEAQADKQLVSEKIGKPRIDRIAFLAKFSFF